MTCACSTTTRGHIARTSPMRFWKNEVGYIGPSALQSGLRAQKFPLVSSPKKNISLGKRSTTMMRCKKNSKGRRQDSMTRGYRSRLQILINIWTIPAKMLKIRIFGQCRRLDRAGPGYRQVADACECGNEPSGCVKCREFLD